MKTFTLFGREFMRTGEDLYEVKRSFQIPDNFNAEALKQDLGCDKLFRKGNFLFCCEKVQDAEILENDKLEK